MQLLIYRCYIASEQKKLYSLPMLTGNIPLIVRNAVLLVCTCTLLACNDEDNNTTGNDTETAAAEPTIVTANLQPQLINQYPHDPAAFTEGLQYVDGYLYESTGQYGSSDIRKTDFKTGKVLQRQGLENKYFGEGMTLLNGKIYQLTYKERTGIIYNQATLKQEKTFPIATDGWGLTNDGTNLIYGDGTDNLYVLEPAGFTEVKRIKVTDQYGPVQNINELEYVNGYIYANQWRTELILKIDPATGRVVAQADLTQIRMQAGIPLLTMATSEDEPEVLNGIAYDAASNRFLVTGKNWPKLLEIKLND